MSELDANTERSLERSGYVRQQDGKWRGRYYEAIIRHGTPLLSNGMAGCEPGWQVDFKRVTDGA